MKFALSNLAIVALCLGLRPGLCSAAPPTPSVDQIMDKALSTLYTTSEQSTYVMRIIGSDGNASVRRMRAWFKRGGANKAKLLIKFEEPADIRGTGLLTIGEKKSSGDAQIDQWLYLPALKRARRIEGGNQSESFLGSDFTVGDFSASRQKQYDFAVQGSQACPAPASGECYVVVGTPAKGVDPSSLSYSKRVIYVSKRSYLAVRTEFYNSSNQVQKVMTLDKIHLDNGKHWLADRAEMKNVLENHSTVIEVVNRDTSHEPPASIFTQSFLERN